MHVPFDDNVQCLEFLLEYLLGLPDDEDLMVLSPRNEFLDILAAFFKVNEVPADLIKRIRLLTCHTSKGLEADHVVVVDFHHGVIPHLYEEDFDNAVALAYVSVSRAKRFLTICTWRGKVDVLSRKNFKPSQFLEVLNLESVSPKLVLERNFDV